jgi:outer membrane immunogenic protein
MRKVLGFVGATLLLAGPAVAADLAVKAPRAAPLAPVFSWTGCYIGANVGGASSKSNFSTSVDPGTHLGNPANLAAVSAAGTGSATDTGFMGGGQVGCNFQSGQWVIGIEGDFDAFDTNPTLSGGGVLTTGDLFAISNSVKTSWLATVRPRAGIAFGPSLLYVTGGVAFTDIKYTQSYADTLFNAVGASSVSQTKAGWTVGAGWEYAFAPNWSFKAEYLYVKFNSVSADGLIVSQTGGQNVLHGSADLQSHIGRVGLNFHF